VEVEIRSDTGEPLGDRQAGRIFIRGPAVMTGYYNDPRATHEVLTDGWLDSGDLGFQIDGNLYISGRAKDVVIIRGANYTSQTIEEALDGVSGTAIAIGFRPPFADGEQLVIIAERAPRVNSAEDGILIERIRTTLLERLGLRPWAVHVLDFGLLPRTTSGKPRRAEALTQFLEVMQRATETGNT
jgi:acyl-CoA synthetase (AMP-forming)/AMP-acid ligase II